MNPVYHEGRRASVYRMMRLAPEIVGALGIGGRY
jgi:hypothetical protein